MSSLSSPSSQSSTDGTCPEGNRLFLGSARINRFRLIGSIFLGSVSQSPDTADNYPNRSALSREEERSSHLHFARVHASSNAYRRFISRAPLSAPPGRRFSLLLPLCLSPFRRRFPRVRGLFLVRAFSSPPRRLAVTSCAETRRIYTVMLKY